MPNGRNCSAAVLQELSSARNAKTQNLDRPVPPAHDLRRFQAVMYEIVGAGVIQSAAQLASDIEKVPDREAFLPRQHGSDAVSLDVLHGSAELTFDFARAVDFADVGTAQNLGTLGLCQ